MSGKETHSKESMDRKKMLALGILGGPIMLAALFLEKKLAGSEPKQKASLWKVGMASTLAGAGTALLALPASGGAVGMRVGTLVGDALIPGSGKLDTAGQWIVGSAMGAAGALIGLGVMTAAALPIGLLGGAAGATAGVAMKLKGGAWAEKAKSTPPLMLSMETLGMSLGKVAEKLAGKRTSSLVRSALGQKQGSENPELPQKKPGF